MMVTGTDAVRWIKEHIRHFTPPELTCRCGCGLVVIDTGFLTMLDQLRDDLGCALPLSSFTRCERHNSAAGGTQTSDHLVGRGADILIPDSGIRFALVKKAVEIGINRIGLAHTFVHVGLNPANPQNVLWLY